jgi:hypothetical protein
MVCTICLETHFVEDNEFFATEMQPCPVLELSTTMAPSPSCIANIKYSSQWNLAQLADREIGPLEVLLTASVLGWICIVWAISSQFCIFRKCFQPEFGKIALGFFRLDRFGLQLSALFNRYNFCHCQLVVGYCNIAELFLQMIWHYDMVGSWSPCFFSITLKATVRDSIPYPQKLQETH